MALKLLSAVLTLNSVVAVLTQASWFYNEKRPLVFGHNGNCGSYPEYSAAAIDDAFLNGADFLEVVIQLSSDN